MIKLNGTETEIDVIEGHFESFEVTYKLFRKITRFMENTQAIHPSVIIGIAERLNRIAVFSIFITHNIFSFNDFFAKYSFEIINLYVSRYYIFDELPYGTPSGFAPIF